MKRSTWTLLAALLLALALPAAAHAASLGKAKLRSATGSLTISEARCPVDAQPGSPDCGKVELDSTFVSAPKARAHAGAGRAGFPLGLRITGVGKGQCNSESPTTVVTGPDGSVQLLTGSARVEPGTFDSTRIVVANGKRGIRVAWLEPLAPGFVCDYFNEPATTLALPAGEQLPNAVVSPLIAARVLKRSRFSVTIAGSKEWNEQAADGTQVIGRANWRLRLIYVN
jgi:hypothetical protein